MDNLMQLLLDLELTTSVINAPIARTEETLAEAKEHLISIDWNTRKVELPSAYQSYISVATDHRASTIYFESDRFFDNVDLAKLNIAIEYVNASGEGRVYPVVDVDYITDPEKLMFGWNIGYDLTKKSGTVRFMVHIYEINPETKKYVYSLHTQPCAATILKTLDVTTEIGVEDTYGLEANEVEALFGRITALEKKAVVWYDLIGTPDEGYYANSNNTTNNNDEWDPYQDNPDW